MLSLNTSLQNFDAQATFCHHPRSNWWTAKIRGFKPEFAATKHYLLRLPGWPSSSSWRRTWSRPCRGPQLTEAALRGRRALNKKKLKVRNNRNNIWRRRIRNHSMAYKITGRLLASLSTQGCFNPWNSHKVVETISPKSQMGPKVSLEFPRRKEVKWQIFARLCARPHRISQSIHSFRLFWIVNVAL